MNQLLVELLKVSVETAITEALLQDGQDDSVLKELIKEKRVTKDKLLWELGLKEDGL